MPILANKQNILYNQSPVGGWQRPEDWLPMPELVPSDDKLVALLLIWEDRRNFIALNAIGTLINWGDGTSSVGSVGVSKTYDYNSIIGTVYQNEDGKNYKQIFLEITRNVANLSSIVFNNSANPANGNDTANFCLVDIIASFEDNSNSTKVQLSFFTIHPPYIELRRIKLKNVNIGRINFIRKLEILDIDIPITEVSGFQFQFGNLPIDLGDITIIGNRPFTSVGKGKKIGNINVISSVSEVQNCFLNSSFEEIGNFDTSALSVPRVHSGLFQNMFNLRKVGNLILRGTNYSNMFNNSFLVKELNITLLNPGTCINLAQNCSSLEYLEIQGAENITNTSNFIRNCWAIETLILQGITIGFNTRDTSITPTSLQTLFDSLGTANGSQTITLPIRLNGEDVTTALNKGYTIAYA